jgi:hypothetical protein
MLMIVASVPVDRGGTPTRPRERQPSSLHMNLGLVKEKEKAME